MDSTDNERDAVARSQECSHGEGHDYTVGSPHLRHRALFERVNSAISDAVSEVARREGSCDVLEIGAGHGSFTETVLAAGGSPTVTEMSKASAEFLTHKFRDRPEVRVVYDTDGSAPFRDGSQYDVILLISVIHHIPDYIALITRLCDTTLRPGGAVVAFQDPLWYPRQTSLARMLDTWSYLAWRVTQGEFRRGLKTRWRRLRGIYDESEPSDLVEYHVVRQGVDDHALRDLFTARFNDVKVHTYFSTQSPLLQAIGAKYFPHNTFGIVATDHKRAGGA
jgi:2-polyprenyl-3-methyl-5-hydroxy-6-metoxy-1,4-benzoquinol methylase